MNTDMEQYLQNQRNMEKKRECFGDACKWYTACFDADNGLVTAINYAKHYIYNWEMMRETAQGLVFWGPPGGGKTYAAACIANDLLERPGIFKISVKMIAFDTILRKLSSMSIQEKNDYLKSLQTCDLLILDDVGWDHRTEYAMEQLQTLIDGRYVRKKSLIVTTNLNLEDMQNPTTIREKRIYSRILENCPAVFFGGDDLRQIIGKENQQQFKQSVKA